MIFRTTVDSNLGEIRLNLLANTLCNFSPTTAFAIADLNRDVLFNIRTTHFTKFYFAFYKDKTKLF